MIGPAAARRVNATRRALSTLRDVICPCTCTSNKVAAGLQRIVAWENGHCGVNVNIPSSF